MVFLRRALKTIAVLIALLPLLSMVALALYFWTTNQTLIAVAPSWIRTVTLSVALPMVLGIALWFGANFINPRQPKAADDI